MKQLLCKVLLASIAAGVLTLAVPVTAHAATSDDPETKKIMSAQAPLMSTADELEAFIAKNKLSDVAGVELDVPGHKVLLYWKGAPPANLKQEIKQLTKKASVEVRPAKYSKAETEKAAKAVMGDRQKFGHVKSVVAKVDGTGLEVGIVGSGNNAQGAYGIDAKEVVQPGNIKFTSRLDDSPYYSGGSMINRVGNPVYRGCSTGFATTRVILTPLPTVQNSMLTAEHCSNGTQMNTPYYSGKEIMGTSILTSPGNDTLAFAANSAGRVYDGGVEDGTEFFKPVTGLGTNRPGTYVCTSGRATGVHCNIKVLQTGAQFYTENGHLVSNAVDAIEMNGKTALGDGDSGGPVFALSSDPNKVLGMGIISSAWQDTTNATTCPTSYATECSRRLYYADLTNTLNSFGLTLRTANGIYEQPQLVSLQSANPTAYYMRHTNYLGYAAIPSDVNIQRESTFWLKQGLAGPSTVTLEAYAPNAYYFRHQGFRIKLNPDDGTQLFKNDASFYPDAGLSNGSRGYISFRSSNAANYYIRHKNFELWVDPNDNSAVFKSDATWKITNPWVYR